MYTYRDAKEGKLPECGSQMYIHGLRYGLCGANIFFANLGADVNARIFKMLGWEDPNELFESVLGYGNYIKATGDASPYAKTYENARKILIKLWETPRYKIHQVVRLGELHRGDNFRVHCTEGMEKYSGKLATIKSFKIHQTLNEKEHKTGHNLIYRIQIGYEEVDWWFSEDMFLGAVSGVESALESKESTIVKDMEEIHWWLPKEDRVNTHSYTSIQLPKQSKNLKITL